MNKVIKVFGETVGKNIETHPQRALSLLKAGYAASELKAKYLPDKKLLPSQQYAAVATSQAIRYPLAHGENSAVVNIFFPCELLNAMGIAPQFVEGLACYINGAGAERWFIDYAENTAVPKSFCSYHKTLLGATLSDVVPKTRFVINTTMACDANVLTFRALADHWKVPHFVIDVPSEDSDDAIEYVELQLKEAIRFIEEVTEQKFDMEKLKEILATENRSMDMYADFVDQLSKKDMSNTLTSEMYKLFFTQILSGTSQGERYFKLLQEDVHSAKDIDLRDKRNNKIRILWVHTIPFWQESIKGLFNNSDEYQLLSIDMNLEPFTALDINEPLKSLAKKMLSNTMRGSVNRRGENVVNMAKKLNADGVIYFNHWGCKKTLGGANMIKEMLENCDIPMLALDGDGCDRNNVNDGQMLTRVQAFLEILRGSRSR